MVVGKPQPVEDKADNKEFYFIEGTRFWGYDKSYTSRSYCCRPGGGYFENDYPITPFEKWAIFTEFRSEDESSLWVQDKNMEKTFFDKVENWHFLDGYYEGGDPNNKKIKNTYMAYWRMIENNEKSGLSQSGSRRRRRTADGQIYKRVIRSRRAKSNEKHIDEVVKPRKGGKKNYLRFMDEESGKVVVANYKIKGSKEADLVQMQEDRSNYEFAVDQVVFDSKEEANAARLVALAEMAAKTGKNTQLYRDLKSSAPKLTQTGYDSKEIMHRFHKVAIDYLTEHVEGANPITPDGEIKKKNQPFFMYLSFRAPHRPSSHNLTFDENNPMEFYPHASIGKPGEQLLLFDEYIGTVMKTLHDLEVADNTLVFFTSDNGPDQGNLFKY